MVHDREVAGIRCTQVLAVLPDVLDGSLPAETLERIHEHLGGCDWCERFGGEYAAAVAALRRELAASPPMPERIRSRLRDRLRSEVDISRSGSNGDGQE